MTFNNSGQQAVGDWLAARFTEMYGVRPRVFRAPGRVNLIGEHTDYNDGFVLPAAIGFYTWVAAVKRADRILEVYSDRFDEKITLSLDALARSPRAHWSDFVGGVAASLQEGARELSGANLFIHGEVPVGAGLSSSASLEVATALALSSVSEVVWPRIELARRCQAAEHAFVGTRCGIMDQFVACFGVEGHALMLDCRSLDYQLLPVPPDLSLIVCNSMVKHELAAGEYNRRRASCEAGAKLLQPYLPGVQSLRDVEIEELERYEYLLPADVYRRCRHVGTENRRVLAAADALRFCDAVRFGQLMYQSHASLRDDFEVSCKELDLLVELASRAPGIYGARMTGGGFGGCTVNLLRADCATEFRSRISQAYEASTGIVPDVYICEAAEGAGVWPMEDSMEV